MRHSRLLLVLGEASSSGFSRVLDNLCHQLATDFTIVRLGINYRGEAVEGRWRLEPNRVPGDLYGRQRTAELLVELDPDVVLLCHDPPLFSVQQPALAGSRARVVFYCAVDFPSIGSDFAEPLRDVDDLVLYTEEAKITVCGALQDHDPSGRMPRLTVLPHGVSQDRFFALPCPNPRSEARERLFPERPELRDAFIVLNANRNSPRKRIDITLHAFAEFAQNRQDAYLYLHMAMCDRGGDVLALARSLGLEHRLLATTLSDQRPRIPDERLNLIYNACDVGVNTCTGEGFGLVPFEHALTGAAQVMPAHASLRSLWGDAATYVPVREEHGAGIVDAQDVARALERLASDERLIRSRSAAAREHAIRPEWNWSEIGRQWRTLLAPSP